MSDDDKLSEYEKRQVKAIQAWKNAKPSIINNATRVITMPVVWIIQKTIPQPAIRGALDFSNWAAAGIAFKRDIRRKANVKNIAELKTMGLELSDKIADSIQNWAISVAAVEGGVAGVTGIVGLTVDIPAIITHSLRTIHKIGLCYGYECTDELDKNFVLSVLSTSASSSMKDKILAVKSLRQIQVTITRQTWKAIAEKAATKKISAEGGIIAVKKLARQLGINITKRKALQAIPFIGAGVGASANAWYIKDVGWTARRAFQERWLIDNGKLIDF